MTVAYSLSGVIEALIDRQLGELFDRLDAESADTEVRKTFHAAAVKAAHALAVSRFADNPHLAPVDLCCDG
ncbi:hypothetical protein [Sphingomonas crocodyli]|uniref:Uncharacterized protein n=1 Tax=Sphingomonas crocodyli TaxID=1979270 RepID=A0A437LYN5_9SPHN|nr:hypothetical protein [Sphingomonas crocodyli]RVT90497.1 hypothetical protein EOD43_19805 [Sphingomonas crocodyli]